MRKINFIFFIVATLALIAFDLYKASHASFTHDESFTYLTYVKMGLMDIISYSDPSTNNHILNTLLMKLSEAMFGSSDLALRLPNILAHLLYLIFTFKLFSLYTPKNCILFFVLINANPFLIDFFSLARGYGLAIGLMTAGLYYSCRFLEDRKERDHVFALAFIGFASLANFALLYVYLIVILVHTLFQLIFYGEKVSIKNIWKMNRVSIIVTAPFYMILYEPIRKVIKYNLLDFAGEEGIWEDTVRSLIYSFVYDASYEVILTAILQIFVLTCSLLLVIKAWKYFSKKDSINLTQKLTLLFGTILFFIAVGAWMQHLLFGAAFMKGRFALFIYPVFILMCSFLFEDLWTSRYKYLVKGFAFFISAVFFLHTCFTLSTNSYYEWQYDKNTKNMLSELERIKPKNEAQLSLGITWLFEPTINYYKKTLKLDWLKEVDRNGVAAGNDYCYIAFENINDIFREEAKLLHYYPDTRSYLIRNHKKVFYLKAANNKYLSADPAHNNVLVADKVEPSETFTMLSLGNDKCAIYSQTGKFLSAELGQQNEIVANRDKISDWETFTMVEQGKDHMALKASSGKYLSVDENTLQVIAKGDSIGKWEKIEMIRKYGVNE